MKGYGNYHIHPREKAGTCQFRRHVPPHHFACLFLSSILQAVRNMPVVASFPVEEERRSPFHRYLSPEKLFRRIVFTKMIARAGQIDVAHRADARFALRQRTAAYHAAAGKQKAHKSCKPLFDDGRTCYHSIHACDFLFSIIFRFIDFRLIFHRKSSAPRTAFRQIKGAFMPLDYFTAQAKPDSHSLFLRREKWNEYLLSYFIRNARPVVCKRDKKRIRTVDTHEYLSRIVSGECLNAVFQQVQKNLRQLFLIARYEDFGRSV